jgi:hypothetical protein
MICWLCSNEDPKQLSYWKYGNTFELKSKNKDL